MKKLLIELVFSLAVLTTSAKEWVTQTTAGDEFLGTPQDIAYYYADGDFSITYWGNDEAIMLTTSDGIFNLDLDHTRVDLRYMSVKIGLYYGNTLINSFDCRFECYNNDSQNIFLKKGGFIKECLSSGYSVRFRATRYGTLTAFDLSVPPFSTPNSEKASRQAKQLSKIKETKRADLYPYYQGKASSAPQKFTALQNIDGNSDISVYADSSESCFLVIDPSIKLSALFVPKLIGGEVKTHLGNVGQSTWLGANPFYASSFDIVTKDHTNGMEAELVNFICNVGFSHNCFVWVGKYKKFHSKQFQSNNEILIRSGDELTIVLHK